MGVARRGVNTALRGDTKLSATSEKGQDKKTQKDNAQTQSDSEARLQEELSRESSEGADSIGDVAANRTLSGSSTWETLPDDTSSAEGAGFRDRKPKQE